MKDASRKTLDRLRAIAWQIMARRYKVPLLVLGGVFLAAVLLLIIIKVPQRQAASWRGQPGVELKDLPKLENDARTTLIQGLGGLALLIGLYLTLRNLQLTQDKQITEHYTRAVEHLGSDQLSMRLGAIYALERISNDSERDYWTIIEILTAYVRERVPIKINKEEAPPPLSETPAKLAIDIQAILTVFGRRSQTFGFGEHQVLDLSFTDLAGAILYRSYLERAGLMGTSLQWAYLGEAWLTGALLVGAYLENANLSGAHLRGAMLAGTNLSGANLDGADLQGALLMSANLEGACGLTLKQLAQVATLHEAHLDPPLLAQIQRHYPRLLEWPSDQVLDTFKTHFRAVERPL